MGGVGLCLEGWCGQGGFSVPSSEASPHSMPPPWQLPPACGYLSGVRRYGMVGSLFRTLVSSRGFPLRSHLDQSRSPLSLGRGRRVAVNGLLLCRSLPPSSFCPTGPSSPPILFPVHLLIF